MTQPSFADILEACTERCQTMDAPLPVRLSALADDVRRLNPEFAELVDRMVSQLQLNAAGQLAPSLGALMPPFLLPDQNGGLVSLGQLLSMGQVVLAFHRGHWCPYCRVSADALARIETKVQAARGQIVVITPEVQKFTRQMKADAKATFPILSDLDSAYALELGLAIKLADNMQLAMTAAGWDISRFMDHDDWTLPIPATFVIGANGCVKARFIDPDYRKRMDVEDILAALRM